MNSSFTCHFSRSRQAAGLLTVLFTSLPACGLFSIDPDEIDIADDEAGDEDVGSDTNANGSDEAGEATGDGDGDSSTTDTTSDPTSGTDTTGDSNTGDTSTGTDTGALSCEFSSEAFVGENLVAVADAASDLVGTCGGALDEVLLEFTAPADGDYQFALASAEFAGVLYLLDTSCAEIPDSCSSSGDPLLLTMVQDESVIVVVDSDLGSGSATIVITGP